MNIFMGLPTPKVIFEADSKFNGHIQVIEFGDVRRVKVDGTDQSVSHNALSCSRLYWGKIVQVLKDHFKDPSQLSKVLILGLGGGTLVHLISKNFPNTQMTSVDIDKTMVEIANNFFDVASIPNHRVIIEDAMRVVIEPNKFGIHEYDFNALIVDIFVGEKYPDLGSSGNFLAAIKGLVAPGGLVIFNRIYKEHHQDDVNNFIEYVQGFYSGVKNLVVAGHTNSDNVLIYATV